MLKLRSVSFWVRTGGSAFDILTGRARRPTTGEIERLDSPAEQPTYIAEIPVQHLNIAVYYLQCYQFVVIRADATDEEQGGVSPVHDLGI